MKRSEIPKVLPARKPLADIKDYNRKIIDEIDEILERKSTIPRPRGQGFGRLIQVDDNHNLNEIPVENNEERTRIPHKKTSSSSHLYKKVQVQEEETGVPRVQVNAGYEHPTIECQEGEECSGVFLNWKLTLYGSL